MVLLSALFAACGDGDAGLSRAEVEEIVRTELAETAAPPQPEPGLTSADVDEAVGRAMSQLSEPEAGLSSKEVAAAIQAALEDLPQTGAGLSRAEVDQAIGEAIAAIPVSQPQAETGSVAAEAVPVSAPSKSDPAAYTRFVVDQAIARYEAEGLDAVLAHHNDPASVDGQWYVFIVDDNDEVIGHYDPERRGLDLKGWVGTDLNGYNFGPEMLAADEAGRWVPYVYVNPAAGTLGDGGAFELKNAWVIRHDGLLFGSGWYINTDEFLPALITESAEHFRAGGLEAILEFYNDPQGISAGLIPTVAYYNSTDTLDGYFSGFIAAPDGEILTHLDPGLIGTDIEDLLGPAVRSATPEGAWITAADNPAGAAGPRTMRIWAVDVNGTLIGGGWYRN